MTGEEFRAFFEQFGPVMDSIVLVDRDTGRSRGFGFVTFESPETSRRLLSMGQPDGSNDANPKVARLEMMGKTIEIKRAEPKESSARRPPSRRPDAPHVPSVTYPPPPSGDPNAFPNAPPEAGAAVYPPPFYPVPGVMYAAPMYYRMPPEGQPIEDVAPVQSQQQPFAMEGYVPAFSFFPSHPYGVPNALPQQVPNASHQQVPVQHPYYPGPYEGVNENNSSA